MHIQSYQIHNVLNVYRRQLSQVQSNQSQHVDAQSTTPDAVSISTEGKNQSVMQKVADRVLKKITNINPGSDFGREMIKQTQHLEMDRVQKEGAFIFNTIVGNNQKETRSIAIDDSQVLMSQLDELAKAAVKRIAE